MIDYHTTPALLSAHAVERFGCPIHYWVGGRSDGLAVVMLHGATMDHRMFNAQVEALAGEHGVVVVDQRAHGRSQPSGIAISLDVFADDLEAVLDATGIDAAVVVGQSLGGYVAQHAWRRFPERLVALAIIGSTPIAKAYRRTEIWALKASLPLFDLWPREHFIRTLAKNTAITEPVRAYARAAASAVPKDEFSNIWKAVTLAVDTEGDPDFEIDVPLLLLHGDMDRTGTIARDMPAWAAESPNAEFHVIPEAGHNANQDNPAAVNRVLADFLRRLDVD